MRSRNRSGVMRSRQKSIACVFQFIVTGQGKINVISLIYEIRFKEEINAR